MIFQVNRGIALPYVWISRARSPIHSLKLRAQSEKQAVSAGRVTSRHFLCFPFQECLSAGKHSVILSGKGFYPDCYLW